MSTSTSPASPVPIITSIEPHLGGIEAWICDIWGVVHNGVAAFPSAVEALLRFRRSGGTVLLMTNAPRPAGAVLQQLDSLSVPSEAYDVVLTSGDLTLSLIDAEGTKPMAHIGPPRDLGLFAGKTLRMVGVDEAEVIVCSGLHDDDRETAEDYRARLVGPASRRVPLICANPDVTVARGDRIIQCAGAIAAMYETMGGPVRYAGKPHLPIYDRAFEMIAAVRGKPVGKSAVLAIGDGINTDVKGALAAGLTSVFVSSPVHMHEPLSAASIETAHSHLTGRPALAMSALAW